MDGWLARVGARTSEGGERHYPSLDLFVSGRTAPTLAANPSIGSVFAGWAGDCSGTASPCALAMTVDHPVSATLLLHQHFADAFESGDFSAWKSVVGGPPCSGAP